MAHGRHDGMVLLTWAQLTEKRLAALGAELKIYEIEHEFCREEARKRPLHMA